jgi:hypothetical protein
MPFLKRTRSGSSVAVVATGAALVPGCGREAQVRAEVVSSAPKCGDCWSLPGNPCATA